MTTIEEMLANAIAEATGAAEPACPLSGDDAIAALQRGFDAYATTHTFLPGELMVQKDGLAQVEMGGERGGNPAIFIRYESGLGDMFEKIEHGLPYAAAQKDCS